MSIKLNHLLKWRARLGDQSSEEARMVDALIARCETDLRKQIADSIETISNEENWSPHDLATFARRIEQTPVAHIEAIHAYFESRCEGQADIETPDMLTDLFAQEQIETHVSRTSVETPAPAVGAEPIATFHGAIRTLESTVAATPGMTGGVQVVGIMRMVALMSQARAARIAPLRMTGTQAVYRHI